MEVVLVKDVPNLGRKGDIKSVKPGYYMNFLAPRGKALRVTPKLQKQLEEKKKQMVKRKAEMLEKIEEFVKKIEKLTITFKRKATAKGKLYAGVTEQQIQHELEKHLKIELDKGCIKLSEPIKAVGEFDVTVLLTESTSAAFKVAVETDK